MEILALIGIAAIIYGIYKIVEMRNKNQELTNENESLRSEKYSNRKQLEKLQKYAKETKVIDHQYIDVILFGPRESGKTSISELWTSPWTQIADIEATHTWRKYEANIFEYEPIQKLDNVFDTIRTHLPVLRIRVRDYPGEDEYRLRAIQDLKELGHRAVVVFVLKVEIANEEVQYSRENNSYFSRAYIQEIEEHLPRIRSAISKAIVVFNKVDLLPPEWDDEHSLQALKEANGDAIYEIERTFSGMIDYHLTSARTNKGIVSLLGKIGQIGVDDEQAEEYRLVMKKLEQEFEMQGI